MRKIAWIFPGQGAQEPNMGLDIISANKKSREIFEKANQLLDFDLHKLCFEDDANLNDTAYTQPALVAVSIALLEALKEAGIHADYTAGLSLGEYTALVASEALSFEDCIKVVRERGKLMQKAAAETEGAMAAIIGSDRETLTSVLENIDGYVTIANFNSPKQLVVAGEKTAMARALDVFAENRIKAIPLNVSGAFHSKLMDSAAAGLKEVLDQIEIYEPRIPYTANVSGQIVTQSDNIKELLVDQVASSVMWEDCVRTLIASDVTTFIEIGPGKTLAGLLKKIDKKLKVINVSDQASLEACVNELQQA